MFWTKVTDALPNVGDRVKVVGKFAPSAVGTEFLRAVYDGVTRNGLSGFRSYDYRAEIGITDWILVNMDYENEADWEWAHEIELGCRTELSLGPALQGSGRAEVAASLK